MSKTIIAGAYLALWVAMAAGVIYAVSAAGHSFWLGAVLAFVLFFVVNGFLAYRLKSRQLRLQGEQPPPFLTYLFFPKPFSFSEKLKLPRPFRAILGLVVLVGGTLLALTGGLLLANLDFSKAAHPLGAVFGLLLLLALGLAIGYVGFRVIVVKNDDPLFGRSKGNEKKPSQIGAA
jgi:hypothetical protein